MRSRLALLAGGLLLLSAPGCHDRSATPRPKASPGTATSPATQPSPTVPRASLPDVLRKRYPDRDLTIFHGYTIGKLPLFVVSGRGKARCLPSWVVGLEAGKLLVGRDLFQRARALEPKASALRLARLTLDVLLQQQGRPLLLPAELALRCPKAPQGAGCQPTERPLVHDPKLSGDQLTFWRRPCYGPGADRVTMAVTAADYQVTEARTILSDAHKKRDPVGWLRDVLPKLKGAGPQRQALKALHDCGPKGSRRLLLELVRSSPFHTIREKAIVTLAHCPHADTTKLLMLRAIADSHVVVRQSAVDVLGTLRDPKAIPLLRRLAKNEGELSVRYAAKRALLRWDGPPKAQQANKTTKADKATP